MKLSVSNIAWSKSQDNEMYEFLQKGGIVGIEIAPTRIFPHNPYDNLDAAKLFSQTIKNNFHLVISSIQSIWFGRIEQLFGTDKERDILNEYTKKAIDFASIINCHNIVFGCPKNRSINNIKQYDIAVDFFKNLGEYALSNDTVVSIEPNPSIYNTNFINTTQQAFKLSHDVNSAGFMVNVDLGTLLFNKETLSLISNNISMVNHIHISEPNLQKIQPREIHKSLKDLEYDNFFSIEMKNYNDINTVKNVILYVKEVFNDI